jgi:hypothetical protein
MAGEGNNRLLAVAKLVRMAKALLVDATRTVYVLSEVVHLLVCRRVRHSDNLHLKDIWLVEPGTYCMRGCITIWLR